MLEQNAAANGVAGKIRCLPFAVSDREGKVLFEKSADNWGDGRVRVQEPRAEDDDAFEEAVRETVEVDSTTFDAMVARNEIDLSETTLVWIDAQGHEAQILGGATSLLASQVPVVAEFWPYGLRRANGLERFYELVASGFREFIDLGTLQDPANPRRQSTDQLHHLTPAYGGATFTDLLLLS